MKTASTSITPARKALYALRANLNGFRVEALVYPSGVKGFAYCVLVDGNHVPGSPAGKHHDLEAARKAAKTSFTVWVFEVLQRV